MALTNTSIDDALSSTFGVQHAWQSGNISRYEIVNRFATFVVSRATKHNSSQDVVTGNDDKRPLNSATRCYTCKQAVGRVQI